MQHSFILPSADNAITVTKQIPEIARQAAEYGATGPLTAWHQNLVTMTQYCHALSSSQAVYAFAKVIASTRQDGHCPQRWRVVQGELVPKVRGSIVVCVHLLADIPLLTRGAITKLLHPAVAKMVLAPPALIPLPAAINTPSLPLQRLHNECVRVGSTDLCLTQHRPAHARILVQRR